MPEQQLSHHGMRLLHHAIRERGLSEDRREVLACGSRGERQLRGHDLLDPVERDHFVRAEEPVDLEALRSEHVEQTLVSTSVASLLVEERAHVGKQLFVTHRIQMVEVPFHAPHEESLAGREEKVRAVRNMGGDPTSEKPPTRHRREIESGAANADLARHQIYHDEDY
jgi:hypothetical protein